MGVNQGSAGDRYKEAMYSEYPKVGRVHMSLCAHHEECAW
jgi:hypothetical protein